jgi:RNA polymerase-binding transcription factor DksA
MFGGVDTLLEHPEHMNTLNKEQLTLLAERIRERKARVLEEIRRGLARSGAERYADLLGEAGDAGDESVASLLRDVTEAEIVRDVGELRDIVAAEQRLATGRYGVCIDCGEVVDYRRLEAYPTAKRCLRCQQHREKTRAPSKYTGR